MGDGQHGALVAVQVFLQPFGGVEVQVVGGLVQQEDIRVLQNQPGQIDPGLFPAGEGGEALGPHVRRDIQAVADLVALRLGVVAPRRLKGGGQGPVALEQGRVAVPLHLPGELGHLVLHGLELVEGRLQHVLHGVVRGIDGNLGDEPQPLARGDAHLPLVVVQLPGENLEQGGFACAVLAQKAHPLPLVHLKAQAV